MNELDYSGVSLTGTASFKQHSNVNVLTTV
jgi:hypothetical protein